MRQEYDFEDFAENERKFVEEYQKNENYISQTIPDNRKDNQVHSTLTKEEMKKLGITEVDKVNTGDTDTNGKCK